VSNNPEGREALIHLHVPAALKARWVHESRSQGQKLSDWIISRVEKKMNVFKVPEALADKYHGSGHALVAVTGGQIVDLAYLEDVLPDLDLEVPGALHAALDDARLAPAVRRLQALGQVSFGMLSCWEFVEL